MDIDYIEIMLTNYETYRISSDNILECDFIIKQDTIECIENNTYKDITVPIIESLLLVIEDYNKIISYDTDVEFNKENCIISQIAFYDKNNTDVSMAYVSLTTENSNDNQTVCVKDDNLYITIY